MTNELHTDDENRWHAEIFYSLYKENVRPAELQEMVEQLGQSVTYLRHGKIRRLLDEHGAIDQLPELAARRAMVPEVLIADRPTDNLEKAILRRQLLCAIQDLLVQGLVERKGQHTFGLTTKGMKTPT